MSVDSTAHTPDIEANGPTKPPVNAVLTPIS
jgi:hypothetical protein